MNLSAIYHQFIADMQHTSLLEYIAVIFGIISVWYSRKENILVYPIGLANTIPYVFISIHGSLFGEASVNFYYTVMSIYGWFLWTKKNNRKQHIVLITYSGKTEWLMQIGFFTVFYISFFISLIYLKKNFSAGAIPWADAFASSTAFTGMWLMARKKVESWYWWIATNVASIPLYFVKHYVFTSVYYIILLVMVFWGLKEWISRANKYVTKKEVIAEWKQ